MSTAIGQLGITGVGQVAVNVHDLPRAVAFYRDVLGLQLLFEIPNAAFFMAGGLRLMLGKPEQPEFDHPASILYYRVGDIHAAADALRSAGVHIVEGPAMIAKMPDHELWMLFFHDTEQNPVALMSEVRAGGSS